MHVAVRVRDTLRLVRSAQHQRPQCQVNGPALRDDIALGLEEFLICRPCCLESACRIISREVFVIQVEQRIALEQSLGLTIQLRILQYSQDRI